MAEPVLLIRHGAAVNVATCSFQLLTCTSLAVLKAQHTHPKLPEINIRARHFTALPTGLSRSLETVASTPVFDRLQV